MTKTYEPVVSKLYPGSDGAAPKFSKEQMEQMMNDPKFREAFGDEHLDPAKFADAFKNGGSASGTTNPDGSVDAKFE